MLIATGGVMVSAKDAIAVFVTMSVTITVKFEVGPPVAGVPLSMPLDRPNVIPLGRAPAVCTQVYGGEPPDAVNVKEYGIPCPPVDNGELLVMVNCAEQSAQVNRSPEICRNRSITIYLFGQVAGNFRTWWGRPLAELL